MPLSDFLINQVHKINLVWKISSTSKTFEKSKYVTKTRNKISKTKTKVLMVSIKIFF